MRKKIDFTDRETPIAARRIMISRIKNELNFKRKKSNIERFSEAIRIGSPKLELRLSCSRMGPRPARANLSKQERVINFHRRSDARADFNAPEI